ncbi:MAG: MBL fold metallo-hydrolase [Rikenellaceae bacterium]
MKLTILGSGTSQGVPTIGCRCEVCQSVDPRDNRLRSSAMIEGDGFRFVIDAGPDFRQQMLRAAVRQIDAILLTHEHKDHVGGIDDVRALNFVDYPTIHRIELYGTECTLKTIRKDYDYAFAADKYRGVPEIELVTIDPAKSFFVKGVEVVPISGHHSPRFSVTGFRFGRVAYLTDFSAVEASEVAKLKGVEVLVVNALRSEPHPSHFNVAQALALIESVAPRRAYLTHMSHEMGLYKVANASLPAGVDLAYDTLEIEI